ncbi:MAG: outer membrane beta-barrel protein [Pseudomonadota bacterium]
MIAGAVAAAGFATGATDAHAQEQCFDKGTLSYVDCPQPPPPPPPPVPVVEVIPPWTGPYVGAHVGWAEGDFDGPVTFNTPFDVGDFDVSGLAFGGHIGYNYQFENNIVVGLEADFTGLGGDDREDNPVTGFPFSESVQVKQNFAGSIRARLGYAIDNVLPFATVGYGLYDYDYSAVALTGAPLSQFNDEELAGGLVAGGGIEWLLNDNISLRGEGLYYFVEEDNTISIPPFPASVIGLDGMLMARGGLSYHF